jgi:citrate lyase beta subunit
VRAMRWVPESCTLPTAEQPLRVAEFDDLFASAVRPAERLDPTGLRLHLAAGVETVSVTRELVAQEAGCCSFFSFDLDPSDAETALEVRVPESQTAVLDAMQERAEAARAAGGRE